MPVTQEDFTSALAERLGEESVRRLSAAGHEIMNHSDSHPDMPSLSREGMLAEIQRCSDKIQAITGTRPRLFRAPSGAYDDATLETVEALGMYCIQWDVDSLDWKGLTAEEMVRRVTGQVQSGSILLFHNGVENTPAALEQILGILRQEGYTFLPVTDMIYYQGYTINHEGRQIALSGEGGGQSREN